MNATHTPGPWYEAKTGNHQGLVISEETGANVAVAYDKRDAALIAAAPDLLEACVKVDALQRSGGSAADWRGVVDVVRAALAKVTS